MWEVVEDGEVKFPPCEFFEVDFDGCARGAVSFPVLLCDFCVEGADGDEAVAKVLGEAGGGFF